jgi:hypothetical protein
MSKCNQEFSFITPITYKKGKNFEMAGNLLISGNAYDTLGIEYEITDIRHNGYPVKPLIDFFRATSYMSCDFIDDAISAHIIKMFDSEEERAELLYNAETMIEKGESLFEPMAPIARKYGENIINRPNFLR